MIAVDFFDVQDAAKSFHSTHSTVLPEWGPSKDAEEGFRMFQSLGDCVGRWKVQRRTRMTYTWPKPSSIPVPPVVTSFLPTASPAPSSSIPATASTAEEPPSSPANSASGDDGDSAVDPDGDVKMKGGRALPLLSSLPLDATPAIGFKYAKAAAGVTEPLRPGQGAEWGWFVSKGGKFRMAASNVVCRVLVVLCPYRRIYPSIRHLLAILVTRLACAAFR
jgi:hypothetical protein